MPWSMSRRHLLLATLAALSLPQPGRAAAARRIVCAGGAMTECVFALGRGAEVVAVDTTSLYPQAALSLPKVGYFRQLSVEGLLSVSPDLVLADRDAGPPNVLGQLGQATQILHQFQGPLSAAAIPDKVRFVAAALEEEARGEAVASAIAADLATLQRQVARAIDRPRAIFMLGTVKGRMAGRGTIAELVMNLAGAENLGADFDGYRPLSAEGIIGLKPDVVITMFQSDEAPSPGADATHRAAVDLGLADLPESVRPRMIVIDGAYLLGLGPRSAHACRDLAVQLHPALDWPALPDRPWVG